MKNIKEKIIGHVEKHGVYNGSEYHNYNLIVVVEENGVPVSCDCKNYKFKICDVVQVLGTDDISEVYGSYISRAFFDKFGKLIGADYE